jgi:hypothetical protein
MLLLMFTKKTIQQSITFALKLKKFSTRVSAPLFIVRLFSKISIALREAIWFGKSQHDKIKIKI